MLLTSFFGAENEARTRDPNLGKVVLYQLSYFRIYDPFFSFGIAKVDIFSLPPNFFAKIFTKNAKICKNARKFPSHRHFAGVTIHEIVTIWVYCDAKCGQMALWMSRYI